MKKKKIWCRTEITFLAAINSFDKNHQKENPKRCKRWRCPDCKKRLKVCSKITAGGSLEFWVPKHKKLQKVQNK